MVKSITNSKVRKMLFCALFAAVLSVSAQITIPFGLIPLSMASFGVLLCSGVLGARLGVCSVLLYWGMGALGVPVFAGFRGGFSVLLSPTGGFLVGYVGMAFFAGCAFSVKNAWKRAVLLLLSQITCYACGVFWFLCSTNATLFTAFEICVLPFLFGDSVKTVSAVLLMRRMGKYIHKEMRNGKYY